MKNIFGKVDFRRVVICVILAAAFGGLVFVSYSIQKRYYSQMEDSLINQYFAPAQKMQAQHFAAKLQNEAENIVDILKVSAEYKILQDISDLCRPEQKLRIEQIAISLGEGVSHVLIVDDRGKIVCATISEMEGIDISALLHIQEQLAAQKLVVSRLFTNPSGEKLISFTVPIFSEKGEYRGALGAALKQEYLKQILSSDSSLVPGGYNVLIDDDSAILYHPNESFIGDNVFGEKIQTAINKNADTNNLFKNMLAAKSGHTRYFYQEGKIAGYAPINLQDGDRFWSVASTANLKDYTIFTEPFFAKGLIINLFLILGVFILIILAVYSTVYLRERERERQTKKGHKIKK